MNHMSGNNKFTNLLIIVAVLLAVVIGLLLWQVLGNSKSAEPVETTEQTPTPAEADDATERLAPDLSSGTQITQQPTVPSRGPVITQQPQNWYGMLGDFPQIFVSAQGEGLTYQWYYRDVGESNFSASTDRDNVYDSYPLTMDRKGRELYCVVTDQYGASAVSSTVTMDLNPAAGSVGPIITSQPQDWLGTMGQDPQITVAAVGEGLSYQWYYRNAGDSSFSKSDERDNSYDSYPLTTERNGREVYCIITDVYGNSIKSNTAVMRAYVPAWHSGPVITSEPQNWIGVYGDYPWICVYAEGDGLTYQWYYRDVGETSFSKSSDTDYAYDSYPITTERNGRELYCVITDMYGVSVTSRTVTMSISNNGNSLAIIYQPENWYGSLGEYPYISVYAEGDGLAYRWYYRDVGETSFSESSETDSVYDSYPLTPERAGRELYCVITDAYGNRMTTDVVTMDIW